MDPTKANNQNLSDEHAKLAKKYGGNLPLRKDLLGHKLQERKYFDSGDYALSQAGKGSTESIGLEHPDPETIPHSNPTKNPVNSSPVKESPLVPEPKKTGSESAPVQDSP